MAAFGSVLSGFAAVLWPFLLLAVFACLYPQIVQLVAAFVRQVSSGARIKYGDLEFRGINIFEQTAEELRGNNVEKIPATKAIFDERSSIYEQRKYVSLIHKIRRSAAPGTRSISGERFDIEISLRAHKKRTGMNAIDFVDYYFGHYFGDQPYGSRYRVRDSEGGFAVVTAAYGEFLCVAEVHFHDGRVAKLDRYVDFAMAPVLPPVDAQSDT